MRPLLRETNQFFSEYMTPVAKTWFFIVLVSFLVFELLMALAPVGGVFQEILLRGFFLTPAIAIGDFNLWQIVTYIFGHDVEPNWRIINLIFDLIVFFFFAPMVEGMLGSRAFSRFIIAVILSSAVFHTAFFFAIGNPGVPLTGVRGIIYAVIFFAVFAQPESIVNFFMIPMKMKMMGLFIGILLAISVISEITNRFSGSSIIGHLGGIGAGYLMYRYPRILAKLSAISFPSFGRKKKRKKGAQVISMGHPGRHSDPDDRYNDPHWYLDQ